MSDNNEGRRAQPANCAEGLGPSAVGELRKRMDALAKWDDVACRDSLMAYVEQIRREAYQRGRMAERFSKRQRTPATADFDLPAPNDPAAGVQPVANVGEQVGSGK